MTKEEQLNILSDCVSQCQKCPQLACARTKTVFGRGNPNAKIVFLGEAPGRNEDLEGKPFVGRAGQLLDNILGAWFKSHPADFPVTSQDVYICNILKCRPPDNRVPTPEEAANCKPFLDLQLQIIKPQYIVCLGRTAAQHLLGISDAPLSTHRQILFPKESAQVMITYHPSYLLRNPAAKRDVWDDLQFLYSEISKS